MMPNEMILFEQTDDLLHDSTQIIESARKSAYQTVDRVLILRNWLLGKRIAGESMNGSREERYGERIIADLAQQLTAKYGSGFDKRSLYRYVKFYHLYPKIVATLKPQSLNQKGWWRQCHHYQGTEDHLLFATS